MYNYGELLPLEKGGGLERGIHRNIDDKNDDNNEHTNDNNDGCNNMTSNSYNNNNNNNIVNNNIVIVSPLSAHRGSCDHIAQLSPIPPRLGGREGRGSGWGGAIRLATAAAPPQPRLADAAAADASPSRPPGQLLR